MLFKRLSTLGFIGYLPASGTWGSVFALPFILILKYFLSEPAYIFLTVILIAFSYFAINKALPCFNSKDPKEVVIDEFAGMFTASVFTNSSCAWLLVAFILFRLLDIFKPLGISWIEKLQGATGVLFDDVAAGLLACLSLFLIRVLFFTI